MSLYPGRGNTLRILLLVTALGLVGVMGLAGGPTLGSVQTGTAGRDAAAPMSYGPSNSMPLPQGDSTSAQSSGSAQASGQVKVGRSVQNDVSPALRDIKPIPPSTGAQ